VIAANNSDVPDVAAVRGFLVELQAAIVAALEAVDGAAFRRDEWVRDGGGGGISMALENGRVLERAGVLFSHVSGDALPPSATASRPQLAGCAFEALGVSLVLHPRNPYAPTVHLNVRHFVAKADAAHAAAWWFGGGFDLTPYYGFEEDAVHWHRTDRIVDSQILQHLCRNDDNDSSNSPQDDRAGRTHPVARAGDGDKTGQESIHSEADVPLLRHGVSNRHRGQTRSARGQSRVRCNPSDALKVHCRKSASGVESVPAKPEQ